MSEKKYLNDHSELIPEGNSCKAEDEIDLVELLLPLWHGKFMVLLIALLTTIAILVYVYTVSPQYRISAQIKPSNSLASIKGLPRNFLGVEELRGLLAASVAELYGQRRMNKDSKRVFPKIELTNPKRSRQGITVLFWSDPKEGREILTTVLGNINYRALHPRDGMGSTLQVQELKIESMINTSREQVKLAQTKRDKIFLQIKEQKAQVVLLDVEAKSMQRKIDTLRLTQRMKGKELSSVSEKMTVLEKAKNEHENNRDKLENDTNRIIELRNHLLGNGAGKDKIQLLLLSNIVQQNISFMDTIEQKITTIREKLISFKLRKEQEAETQQKLDLEIAGLQDSIDQQILARKSIIKQKIATLKLRATQVITSEITLLEQKISLLQKQKAQLALIDIVRPPFASLKPVKPNKRKSVALALVFGLFLGTIAVYVRHFWHLQRERFCIDQNLS